MKIIPENINMTIESIKSHRVNGGQRVLAISLKTTTYNGLTLMDEFVLTKNGFVKVNDLKIGDEIIATVQTAKE